MGIIGLFLVFNAFAISTQIYKKGLTRMFEEKVRKL